MSLELVMQLVLASLSFVTKTALNCSGYATAIEITSGLPFKRGEKTQIKHSVPDPRSTVEVNSGLCIANYFFSLYNVENDGCSL